MPPQPLILASASPRRRELLTQAGFTFTVTPADIDETQLPDESPNTYVQRLALEKARAIHALHPTATVLGADTTVDLDGHCLHKPRDPAEAATMLRALAARDHHVHTGIAAVSNSREQARTITTTVTFSAIDEISLAHYIATGDPLDKAGAYGIQGFPARWIPSIHGDFFNVMGLPIAATVEMLAAFQL